MALLPLTIALWSNDRTRALEDGRVKVEGCDVNFFPIKPEEMFLRAFGRQEFDVSELSMSNYLSVRSRGECPYIALPVFPSRKFRHSGIYIRTDRGIDAPQDLAGKTIGVPEYQVTASVWLRGMLQEKYGVAPSDMKWRTGGLEQAGREETVPLTLPDGVDLHPIAAGKTLFGMIESGEIDALIAPRPPTAFIRKDARVRRLFPDYVAEERAYYKETGIFPIMHVMGVLQSKTSEHPWLAFSLLKAFNESKAIAMAELRERQVCKVTLPWLEAIVDEMQELMGPDYWPFGVEPNRTALEALSRYHYQQGLSTRHVPVDEMFAAGTYTEVRV
ncbi:MAG: ABC transporter substrate-binding protein [Hyphomicrobiaceae bacterium]